MEELRKTIRQVVFERDMLYGDHSISFFGLTLCEDKEVILAILDELYELFGIDSVARKYNEYRLEEISKSQFGIHTPLVLFVPFGEREVVINSLVEKYDISIYEETVKPYTVIVNRRVYTFCIRRMMGPDDMVSYIQAQIASKCKVPSKFLSK